MTKIYEVARRRKNLKYKSNLYNYYFNKNNNFRDIARVKAELKLIDYFYRLKRAVRKIENNYNKDKFKKQVKFFKARRALYNYRVRKEWEKTEIPKVKGQIRELKRKLNTPGTDESDMGLALRALRYLELEEKIEDREN